MYLLYSLSVSTKAWRISERETIPFTTSCSSTTTSLCTCREHKNIVGVTLISARYHFYLRNVGRNWCKTNCTQTAALIAEVTMSCFVFLIWFQIMIWNNYDKRCAHKYHTKRARHGFKCRMFLLWGKQGCAIIYYGADFFFFFLMYT